MKNDPFAAVRQARQEARIAIEAERAAELSFNQAADRLAECDRDYQRTAERLKEARMTSEAAIQKAASLQHHAPEENDLSY